eukprot:g16800.t1
MQIFLAIATPQILLTPPCLRAKKKGPLRTSLDQSSASRLWAVSSYYSEELSTEEKAKRRDLSMFVKYRLIPKVVGQ